MNYEEKYKEALKVIESLYNVVKYQSSSDALLTSQTIEKAFPELRESEDELMRKEAIAIIKQYNIICEREGDKCYTADRVISWLEKQGKQKPSNEVKPKFKVGDWVQIDGGHVMKILDVKKDALCYKILNWCGNESVRKISDIDSIAHLWTIQDAKNGDVLATRRSVFIFKKEYISGKPEAHCGAMDGYFIAEPEGCWTNEKCNLATKEQCDFLFSKMKEAGYEWDAEKKELKKIEPKSAWSEEDERILNKIQDHLREFYVDKKGYPYVAEPDSPEVMEKNWLQSFKDRVQPNHWKPSEEQMEALIKRTRGLHTNSETRKVLESLIFDLQEKL